MYYVNHIIPCTMDTILIDQIDEDAKKELKQKLNEAIILCNKNN